MTVHNLRPRELTVRIFEDLKGPEDQASQMLMGGAERCYRAVEPVDHKTPSDHPGPVEDVVIIPECVEFAGPKAARKVSTMGKGISKVWRHAAQRRGPALTPAPKGRLGCVGANRCFCGGVPSHEGRERVFESKRIARVGGKDACSWPS